MEKIVLKASRRPAGKNAKSIRREGLLPAVMYGHHYPSTPIVLNAHQASLILPKLSSSAIVTIDLEGETQAALIREKQRDYLRNSFVHIDFQIVSLTEKLRTTVALEFVGVSPAVKDFNGVVVHSMSEIEVESLPQYLPERISVDISSLAKIGDALHVRDLQVAPEVAILEDLDEVVVIISFTKEETVAAEPGAEIVEPEVIERGKKEEEEEK
jgi:large subunit ribosomal protein L25